MQFKKVQENTFIFTALFIIFYLLIKNALHAPFTVEDEYLNIAINNPNQLFGPESGFFDTLWRMQKSFLSLGRLFIVHVFLVVVRAKTFGLNPMAYHWVVFAFGLVSAFLIYIISRKLNISKLISFIGAFVFLTGSAYSEIFMRLHTGEATGIIFLLIAVYSILKIDEAKGKTFFNLALFSAFLAAFSKESFIFLFPLVFTIPFLRVETLKWKQVFNKFKVHFILVLILFFTILLSLIIAIKFSGKVFGYGQPLTLTETLINNTIWIFKWFALFSPIVIVAIIDVIRKKKIKEYFPFIIFCLAWLGSQLIIYYKIIISFSQGRYMMPAGLIFIFALIFSLEYIKRNYILLFRLMIVLILVLLIRNAKITYINANEFNARANAFNLLVDKMIEEKPKKISVYGGVEFFQSINTHFTLNNYHPEFITTPVVLKNDHNNPYADASYLGELQADLNSLYELRTLKELIADTTVNTMITAEPEEYLPVNYQAIMKTFKHVERVSVGFSNPGLSDMLNPSVWCGNFKNSKRTYLVFKK